MNLLECEEREKVAFDAITQDTTETDSHVGKIAADLQMKTYRIFQRRR